jgi:DNA adenine methylase
MLAPWIISHFPEHRTYVEPFGGAGSVLLQKPRTYSEVYNDLDGEVVNLFRIVRDNGAALIEKLRLTPFAREEYRLSFLPSDDPFEQARRTVVRSFMGFGSNSLCRNIKSGFRANSSRSGTTPAHDWLHYPDVLTEIIGRLRGVVIEHKDAAEVILQHDAPWTLHYCDPPYVHSSRSGLMHGWHGYTHEMTDEQHEKLAEVLHGLRGMVIVSAYRCYLYDRLYSGWRRKERIAHADGARRRVEVLWISPNTPAMAGELFPHSSPNSSSVSSSRT